MSFILYPVAYYTQGSSKPESPFNEQNMAIYFCTSAIDSYAELSLIFLKSAVIRGFLESLKTWCMKYFMVWVI